MGKKLLFTEGLAVGALIHGGILLMGSHQNPIQGAVVFSLAVMGALLYGTFNAAVCVTVHVVFLLSRGIVPVWPEAEKLFRGFCQLQKAGFYAIVIWE